MRKDLPRNERSEDHCILCSGLLLPRGEVPTLARKAHESDRLPGRRGFPTRLTVEIKPWPLLLEEELPHDTLSHATSPVSLSFIYVAWRYPPEPEACDRSEVEQTIVVASKSFRTRFTLLAVNLTVLTTCSS
jgi:hypothetical protein